MAGPTSYLHPIDWAVVLAYVAFAVAMGIVLARRAGRGLEEYFLTGRTLPWWVAGTSMVATSFAADTPLLITGWVRDFGIWKNWAWWCFTISVVLQVFFFSRWWRRGGVMTKAEVAELRYGGREARALRGFLGVLHAGFTNTIIICWVMLAAAKIIDVLFGVDQTTGLVIASVIALTYSLLAGLWGVVMTDLVQFAMAMVGAIALAVVSWGAFQELGGLAGALADGTMTSSTLAFLPPPGDGVPGAPFWTASTAAVAVYLGISWWAAENVDGSGAMVQRVAAARDVHQGMLATLWFNVAHFALRPWPWIAVGLASLVVLPNAEITAPHAGVVEAVSPEAVVIAGEGGTTEVPLTVATEGAEAVGWRPIPFVEAGSAIEAGAPVARTDSERAYVAMMRRFLPVGLLGLVAASLLAAFMSTIDTHVNLASSFFVNDVYKRFLARDREDEHYVLVARLATVAVLVVGGFFASQADSISDLFLFFLAFLGGVGPVYVMRWFWWRIRASTEITAMAASATAATFLTHVDVAWSLGPLSDGGALSPEGRLCLVVLVSLACALVSLAVAPRPDPATLTDFYRRVRPLGWWGPVKALCPDVAAPHELRTALVGVVGSLTATFGAMLGLGYWLLDREAHASVAAGAVVVGTVLSSWAIRRLAAINARAAA